MQLRLNKLPWKAQLALFLVVSVAGGGAFYYYYATPVGEQIAARRTELASLTADIQKGLHTARKLHEFRREVGELEARLQSLRAVLPEQKDYADILRRIQGLASQSNLRINKFTPEAIATKELHAEWPIRLELDGTYHNLGMFFDRISKFSRIINVSDIQIKSKAEPSSSSTIDAVCVATTFVLLQQPATKPKPAAPRPAATQARAELGRTSTMARTSPATSRGASE